MKKRLKRREFLVFPFFALLVAFSSCGKKEATPSAGGNGDTTTTGARLSDEDSLKFYVWWINQSDSENIPLYYWNDQVTPADPFSSQFSTGEDVLNYMKSFPVVNGKKVDRYSFLDRTGVVSDELQGGISGDFGFDVSAVYDDASHPNNIGVYIIYVYPGSPAGQAGVQRGWKIASYDNTSTSDLTDQSDLTAISEAIYSDPSTTFTFLKEDGSETPAVSLTRNSYHINPVLFDSVYTLSNEKVGYLVYNSFISVGSDANGIQAKQEIDDAFNGFKSAGVKDLVVDLRYNGGGAVVSTEYLDNLIAPASANGQPMYSYKYNTPLTSYFNSTSEYKSEYIDPVKFDIGTLNLNLNRVFFIVGSGTASAAELTINNLKPYMEVKLIGDTTYGKPVGFFTVPIEFVTDTGGYAHVADMYAINFQSVNKNGEGSYYSGMAPDYLYRNFNGYDWGDTRDVRLESALNFIENGSYTRKGGVERKVPGKGLMREVKNKKLMNPGRFNGMVDYRLEKDRIGFPGKK